GEVQAAKSCWRRASGEVALFLARAHAKTSRFVVGEEAVWRRLLRTFANPDMVELSDKVIFREPLELACPHNRHSRALADLVARMRSDEHVKAAVRTLRGLFLDRPQALLHGDLHTGSVMFDPVDELAGASSAPPSPMHGAPPPERPARTWIMDQEFAFMGPVAFDLGKWVGNLLLAAWGVWARGRGRGPADAPDASPVSDANSLEACIRRTACAFWEQYVEEFLSIALGSNSQHTGLESLALKAECLAFLDGVQRQALGFAGIVMVRRLVGVAHVADMDSIPDDRDRDCAELAALTQGVELLQAFWRGERGEGWVTIEQALLGQA
ncbi:hypothetical protein H632_c2003p0, partial [Helicosporidium sp. ATCC 50920]